MTYTNEELLEMFTTNAKNRPFKLSDNTVDMYNKHIGYFLSYIGNKNILTITRKDVKGYMLSLKVSDSTYNLSLSAIRTLYKILAYLLDDEDVIDVTFGLVSIRDAKTVHKIPLNEVEKSLMFKYCKNSRDYAIMLTLLSSGLRIHELISLTLNDYANRDEDGKIHLTITKGSKERDIWLNQNVCDAIDKYLLTRKDTNCDNLFISNGGVPMDRSCCSRTLKTIARRAGLSEERVCKISNHCTRATKATDMANDGYDIQTIATVLGHSNIQTTFNSYIKMDESKIMRAFA